MRKLLLVVLVACSGGDASDPHELTTCSTAWSGQPGRPGQCEQACAARPSGSGTCTMTAANGMQSQCDPLFIAEYDGQLGCCVATDSISSGTMPIRFVECD